MRRRIYQIMLQGMSKQGTEKYKPEEQNESERIPV
jgi:hypothetical protein